MDVAGFWPTVAAGVSGAIVAELIAIATALKAGKPPTRFELLGSLVTALLGFGVVFYGTQERSFLEAATLGAAFPLLFAANVRVVTEPRRERPSRRTLGKGSDIPDRPRTVIDWISRRI